MKSYSLRHELFAEFLGTLVLLAFGSGVVAQVILSNQQNGTYLSINLAWGLGVTMGIYVAGGVTGAHLNPAVTLALAVRRGFSWPKVIPYWIAQTAGAFSGAALVFFVYREAFDAFDNGSRVVLGEKATAGIFSTYPQPFLSSLGGLIDQVFGTAILLLVIMAIADARNNAAGSLAPIVVGFLVMVIGMSFGFNAGYAINPARDLGPRLFTAIAGWGAEVFRAGNHWFWVPIAGPLIGGPLGALAYDALIGRYFPKED
ncbi:MAG: aquaporin family protein [Blastocatellia bacterium]|nr:aquaporin family protein [Blastocatellia bacterium]